MRFAKHLVTVRRLPLYALILIPFTISAQPRIPLQGSFAVSAEASPNIAGSSFCGGSPTDQVVIEAHGTGFSDLGAFTFTLHKTLRFGASFEYHGCLVLTAPNGDTLNANYDLTQSASASNFSNASGTLTITSGTGRFKGVTGTLRATAVFLNLYPASSFVGGSVAPLQVAAYYVVNGTLSLSGNFD